MRNLLCMVMLCGMLPASASQTHITETKDLILNLIDSAHPMYRYFSDPSEDSYRLKSLIENNPDLYISDPVFANTLLLKAIEHYLNNIVERLIKANIQLNTPGKNGKTPLMVAAQTGNGEAVNLLMAHGANPYLQNEQDGLKTAGEYAEGDIKKVFDKALKAQRTEKNIYETSKLPVQAELNKHFINDISKIIEGYAYTDDYADYKELIKNSKKLSRHKKSPKKHALCNNPKALRLMSNIGAEHFNMLYF